jgi:TatD DNase family protein
MKYDFLVDSHCHLALMKNPEEAVKEALANGVGLLHNVCTHLEEMPQLLRMAEQYSGVFCSVGQHPEELWRQKICASDLLDYTTYPRVIAIGESGLDYHQMPMDREGQRENFLQHIEASRKSGLPLVIHSRDADADMLQLLTQEMQRGKFSFVFHCFCGGPEMVQAGLDLGGYFSIAGVVTFKNSLALQKTVITIPLDRLLVETDAPFLSPEPFRGKSNRPVWVKETAKFVAKLKGVDEEIFREQTTKNALTLFTRMKIS